MPFKDKLKQLAYGRKYQAERTKALKFYEEVDNIRKEARKIADENRVARQFCSITQMPNKAEDYVDAGVFRVSHVPIISKHIKLPITSKSIEEATLKIVEEEDKLLLVGEHKGWSCLGLEGLATAKGRNIVKSSGDLDRDLTKASKRLYRHNQDSPYVIVTSSEVDDRIRRCGKVTMPFVAQYYSSRSLCDAEGNHNNMLVVKPDLENFRIILGVDLEISKIPNGYILHESLVMNIPNPKAICEIQGVGD
jgi:hypothetical protein